MKTLVANYLLGGLLLLVSILAHAQSRVAVSIDETWEFTKDKIVPGEKNNTNIKWMPVSVPHSWNNLDVMDDEPGYYRGEAWYRKKITVPVSCKTRSLFLRFEGSNQITTVYMNGKEAGKHIGGYTSFQFPINAFLNYDSVAGNNEILVKVDNKHNQQVAPLSADFTFFGGLYRDVWLLNLNEVHFSMDNYGSSGVFVSTPSVSKEQATVRVSGSLRNEKLKTAKIVLQTIIQDRDGKLVKQLKSEYNVKAQTTTTFSQELPSIINPELWSPQRPYLYTIKTSIRDAANGQLLDEMVNPLGFRWFRFDAANGFFLNGEPLKLVGASRHQDRAGIANAVSDDQARNDMEWLKKMGGNFLRVAHYPQDPTILEACDRMGIITSVEIPVVNEITESDSFYNNCVNMQVEMIRQYFNHPSIVIWCYMNEVLLRPHFNDDKEKQKIYFGNITALAKLLDSVTRSEDASRYTMIANHGDFDKYRSTGLTDIPMIVGWNLYSGWYGGELQNFASFLDKHRQQLPNKPMVVAEYGADADPRIRSFQPVRFDKSVEYTTAFHQYYFTEMMKRPHVAAAMIWNLADFNSETREETMPHINNKGLLTWNRTAKDPYYLYQALLSKEPFIKILSGDWDTRTGVADSGRTSSYQSIQVATNIDSIELFRNGQSLGWRKAVTGICEWKVPFEHGMNKLVAGNNIHKDYLDVFFRLQPYELKKATVEFTGMNILLGANRYFIDQQNSLTWQPDQLYRNNSWGHVGGRMFKAAGNGRLPYGTDKDIKGTDNDPVYQTQQIGISDYRMDVPVGQYELTLHFAELEGVPGKSIPYNLNTSDPVVKNGPRRFHVYVNDVLFLENFDIAAQFGTATAVAKKTVISVTDQGIRLKFVSVSGEPVLNALQLRKIF